MTRVTRPSGRLSAAVSDDEDASGPGLVIDETPSADAGGDLSP